MPVCLPRRLSADRWVKLCLRALVCVPALTGIAQAQTASSPGLDLRGADSASSSGLLPNNSGLRSLDAGGAAGTGSGTATVAPSAAINYGRPRRAQTLPRPRAPNPSLKPGRPPLPALQPYATSAEAKRALRPGINPRNAVSTAPSTNVAVVPTIPAKGRPKPEPADPFGPLGINVGSLRLLPYIEGSGGFDSNPNRVTNPTKGSPVARGDAGVAVQSQWSQHDLRGTFRFGYAEYFAAPQANRPDGAGDLTARIDVTRDTAINLNVNAKLDTLRPGSPELSAGGNGITSTNRPIVFSTGGYAGVTQKFNRFEVSLRGTIDRQQYQNATFSDGSVQLLTQNDYSTVGLRPRVSYELTPGIKPFVEATLDKRMHDNGQDQSGFKRNSTGMALRGGTTFEMSRVLTGEISGGWIERSYEDTRLANLRGPAFDAALIYTASPLTTVTLRGSTTVNETNVINASASISRKISGEISHAFFRNFTMVGGLSYGTNTYKGADINERSLTGTVRAEYNLTRSVVIKASYTHERLNSNVQGSDYTANVFLLGLRLQR